jgi:GT2 family glycosyltransferase
MQQTIFVIIPNYNGSDHLAASIDSVLAQSLSDFKLIIVDNGSVDDSRTIIEAYEAKDDRVTAIFRNKNYGYTGGVNPGLELAITENASYAAPFNNDAVAHKDWLKHLAAFLDTHPDYGIAACSLQHADGKTYDSTADLYTSWGLPYPRGRDEPVKGQYDDQVDIFGASGGASMYRVAALKKTGIFDQDFFAYYEDIDLSFRTQLAGFKVAFVPQAIVYHEQGKTSEKMRSGFTTHQYMKNLPLVLIKDVPAGLLRVVLPRLWFAYTIFFINACLHGKGWPAFTGWLTAIRLLPKKLGERRAIQKNRVVSVDYIWSTFTHDLPPNAHKLRKLRSFWWRLLRRTNS